MPPKYPAVAEKSDYYVSLELRVHVRGAYSEADARAKVGEFLAEGFIASNDVLYRGFDVIACTPESPN